MSFRSLVAVPCVALALAGCSSSSGSSDTVPAGATLIKAEQAITWDAKTYTATAVDGKVTISLRNESSLPHNLHLLDAKNVDKGIALTVEGNGDLHTGTVSLPPGAYKVICTIPAHGNMKATLTVTSGRRGLSTAIT
jgi:plastocyanin